MDDKNLLALALLKSLNGGSIPSAATDFTTTLTQANRTSGANVRVLFDFPNPTRNNDGTVTIHVSLNPSDAPIGGVTGSL